MNRYRSASIGLFFLAALAQGLTWTSDSGDVADRIDRVVLLLLAGAIIAAIFSCAPKGS